MSNRTIVRGAFLSTAGMVMMMAGQVAAVKIYTGVLPEADVGVFMLLLMLGDLGIVAVNCGLWPALPKLVASAPESERGRLIGTVIGIQVLSGVAVGLAVLLAWFAIGDPSIISENPKWVGLYPFLWALPAYMVAGLLRENSMASLAGLNRYASRAFGLVLGALANVGLVALIVWFLGKGLAGLVVSTLGAHFAAALILYISLPVGRRPRADKAVYLGSLSFSWPLYANALLNFVFQRLDTFIVYALLTPQSAAFFELGAKRLALYGSRILQAALVPYLPNVSTLIARGERAGAARLLDRASNMTTLVCYTGSIVGILLQRPIVEILCTKEYLKGLPALPPLLLATGLVLQAGLMGQSLVALGKPRLVTAVNVMTALLSAGLNLALIPWLGLAGAGWAAVGAMAFTNAAQTYFVRRNGLNVDLRRHVQTHAYMVGAIAYLAWAESIGLRVLALPGFLTVAIGTGSVPPSELLKAAKALLPSRR